MSIKRTITYWDSQRQKRGTFETEASTQAQLLQELQNHGVNLTNMDIQDGVSKSVITNSNSSLPTNINYKGSVTNNMALFITLKNKNVSSGAMSRKEIGAYIKKHNLGDKVKETFGDNWTRVSTINLLSMIENDAPIKKENKEEETAPKAESTYVKEAPEVKKADMLGYFRKLNEALLHSNCITEEDKKELDSYLEESNNIGDNGFSLDEMSAMGMQM